VVESGRRVGRQVGIHPVDHFFRAAEERGQRGR
jgi:hypothetical protein